jgi:hypothetical protein
MPTEVMPASGTALRQKPDFNDSCNCRMGFALVMMPLVVGLWWFVERSRDGSSAARGSGPSLFYVGAPKWESLKITVAILPVEKYYIHQSGLYIWYRG